MMRQREHLQEFPERLGKQLTDKDTNFAPFDPDLGLTLVGPYFRKYLERYKVYAVVMNVMDKAKNRAVFLHYAGPKVQDIFDTLDDTGKDFKTAAKELLEYFELKWHRFESKRA